MIALNYAKNYLSPRSFLINSLPKSGTHLLCKAIRLFPGVTSKHIHISRYTLNQLASPDGQTVLGDAGAVSGAGVGAGVGAVPIGIDWPAMLPTTRLEENLSRLKKRRFGYATCHIPFHQITDQLVQKFSLNTFLILRDPRDVALSHAKYVSSCKEHFLYSYYQTLSESDRVMTSICGVKSVESVNLLDISERYRSVEGWRNQPYNYTTYFEKLIGSKGGGTQELQHQELTNIANHLGLAYQSSDIKRISTVLFGGTVTFHKGNIGRWKDELSKDHKQAFKNLAGQLLIDLDYERDLDW